ncbi:MAG: energy-coupling factor transporter transmembrane protein EcfT [Thermoplasmata archaeon]|nr:energy-coupling factor transporter transmembrane protein EcfT [Thermoplasmata archaeon]
MKELDPRVTFIGVIVVSTAAFVLDGPTMLPLLLILLLMCAYHSEDIRRYGRGVRGLLMMMAFIGLIQSVHPHGNGLISLSFPHVGEVGLFSVVGFETAARIMGRIAILVMTTMLFASTVDEGEFLRGLSSFRIPYPAIFSINLVLRLIPDLSEDLQEIEMAFRGRDLGLRRGYLGRWRNYTRMIKPLFLRHLRLAYLMGLSLELRGFSGKRPREHGSGRALKLSEKAVLLLLASGEVLLFAWGLLM